VLGCMLVGSRSREQSRADIDPSDSHLPRRTVHHHLHALARIQRSTRNHSNANRAVPRRQRSHPRHRGADRRGADVSECTATWDEYVRWAGGHVCGCYFYWWVTGRVASSCVWPVRASAYTAEHFWTLSLAFATYLILIYPLNSLTMWLERKWAWLWGAVWALSFGIAVLSYELYGFTPSELRANKRACTQANQDERRLMSRRWNMLFPRQVGSLW
jgi:hypothetical protein